MPSITPPTDCGGFEIALICALPLEADCVQALFDTFWEDEGRKYPKKHGDPNNYTTGVISGCNVVLAYLPDMGLTSAAAVSGSLHVSFPNIKLALVIGICGGVPGDSENGIRLGDVIVSEALVQYDYGRQYPGTYARKDGVIDTPQRLSPELRGLLRKLRTYRYQAKTKKMVSAFLVELEEKLPETKHPGRTNDLLYRASYPHSHTKSTSCNCAKSGQICDIALSTECEDLGCDPAMLINRGHLVDISPNQPNFHFGIIGTGNTVMKSGSHRDAIAKANNLIAFEMEGAGVWEYFPSLVIKGVCDYADSHKRKGWQRHAAAVAAAYSKALLCEWSSEVSPNYQGVVETTMSQDRSVAVLKYQDNAALIQATTRGDWGTVHLLLTKGADVQTYDENLMTPMHIAAAQGYLNLIHLFINWRGNIQAQDLLKMQPLHHAAKYGHPEIVEKLLISHAPTNIRDEEGRTPLHWAAENGNKLCISHLLEHGANLDAEDSKGCKAVRLARRARNMKAMKMLVQGSSKSASVLEKHDYTTRTSHSNMYASTSLQSVETISVNPDTETLATDSPLHRAVRSGVTTRIEDCLDSGATADGKLLYEVASRGKTKFLSLLADVAQDIDACGGFAGNALCIAALNKMPNTMKILLERGANVNWQGGRYGNALQAAAATSCPEAVRLLIEAGADVNAQNGHYGNALTAAARHSTNFERIATFLLEKGAYIDAEGPSNYGNPLQTAVWMAHIDSVQFLLQKGANPNISGLWGSAIHIAKHGLRNDSIWWKQQQLIRMLDPPVERVFEGREEGERSVPEPSRSSSWFRFLR